MVSISRRFAATLSLSALFALGAISAHAQEAFDLIVNGSVGSGLSIAPQDPGVPTSELFLRRMNNTQGYDPTNPFLGVYTDDTGFDVFPGIDTTPFPYDTDGIELPYEFPLSQVKIEQVSISPGLFCIYQYDGTTPVFGRDGDRINPNTNTPVDYLNEWYLSENPISPGALSAEGIPLYFHQHFQFYTDNPGVYTFQFRLTNAQLVNGGGALPNSGIYTITYLANVPEPGTWAAFGAMSLSGVLALRRRRH